MKKLLKPFYSFWVILPAMFVYAFSCAIATFIENDFGSVASRAIIYDSYWFNALHVYLMIALVASFIVSNALKRKKFASIILHFSFIVIIIGAGITRYFGEEGTIDLQENEIKNEFLTTDNYLNITAITPDLQNRESKSVKANLSIYGTLFHKPKLKEKISILGNDLTIESKQISLIESKKNPAMAMEVVLTYNGESKNIEVYGGNSEDYRQQVSRIEVGGIFFALNWGSKKELMPFKLKLTKFDLETYAGSSSPSSYASNVEVLDNDENLIMPFRIYMNNVLDFGGYRFYQSRYFQNPDGSYSTGLSINKDPGKLPTYVGYFLLIIGSIMIFFSKNGRFRTLADYLKNHGALALILALMLVSTNNLKAESSLDSSNEVESKKEIRQQDKEEIKKIIEANLEIFRANSLEFSKKFAKIQIQDYEGRIQPFDTIAQRTLVKLTKKESFKGLNATQVMLGFLIAPNEWVNTELIKTETKALRKILGVDENQKFVTFMDIIDFDLNASKLKNYVADILEHKAQKEYTTFDKDVMAVNERFDIIQGILNLYYLQIFPEPNTKKWFSIIDIFNGLNEIKQANLSENHELAQAFIKLLSEYSPMMTNLIEGVELGSKENKWAGAEAALNAINEFQKANGGSDYLSENRVNTEIFLNHFNAFKYLIAPYILLGLVGFFVSLVFIIKDEKLNKKFVNVCLSLLGFFVVIHTIFLIIRWYVGDHAPWSNGYESMLYIAWAAAISGVIFFRKYLLAICVASFMSGISLLIAHIADMNPQITNLVPVLKSYWLNIHVSVITASYGLLGLSFILGIFVLILFGIRNNAQPQIDRAINSINALNEMNIILGLILLLVGNFLGAIWANESWGRYWGWDPKETWALISIGIYAIVLHLRFLGIKNLPFVFASASVLAFYSILMTYFGVNYYLSGMHSYAAGESVPLPWYLYLIIFICFLLIILAWRNKEIKSEI